MPFMPPPPGNAVLFLFY